MPSCAHLEAAPRTSAPARHATAHHAATGHPVIASAEPREHWRWCFVDEVIG